MDSAIRMLKLLIGRRGERFTIRKMSEALGINYRIAHGRAAELEKDGLIKVTRAGSSKICEFTDKFDSRVFEAENSRRDELFRNKDLLVLHNRLAELRFPFVALLFGSHAKGTADRHSDMDVLAVGGDEKEIRATLSLLPGKIHLTAVSYESFIRMAKSREFTVVSEALKGNVILIGIEEYYRLIANAG